MEDGVFDPIIIVSTGACGSSSLAEILIKDFSIYMGDPDKFTPVPTGRDGARSLFEDHQLLDIIYRCKTSERDFAHEYGRFIEQRLEMNIPWGFKVGGWDTETLHNWMLAPFEAPIILRLERDCATAHQSIRSMSKNRQIIRDLLGARKVFPIYLSEIVHGSARDTLELFFLHHHPEVLQQEKQDE